MLYTWDSITVPPGLVNSLSLLYLAYNPCAHVPSSCSACDLVYLGSVDVAGPGSEVMLAQTVQQRKSLDISVSVVNFKASKEGITISDNING